MKSGMLNITKGKEIAEASGESMLLAFFYGGIGDKFVDANRFDSALFYHQKALAYFSTVPFSERKFVGLLLFHW
ncbi:MAG: hypothetical protein WKF59_19925 [Chitinophagaceae bacterium]